jgi:hypothetical protein
VIGQLGTRFADLLGDEGSDVRVYDRGESCAVVYWPCTNCGTIRARDAREWRRRQARGQDWLCSRRCGAIVRNRKRYGRS